MMKQVRVQFGERVLVFRDGRFDRVLDPGRFWVNTWGGGVTFQRFRVSDLWVEGAVDMEMLLRDPAFFDRVEVVELGDTQRAVVRVNGRFDRLLGPGQHVYWKGVRPVTVDVVDVGDGLFRTDLLPTLWRWPEVASYLTLIEIDEGKVGLIYRNGVFLEQVPSGRYAAWQGVGKTKVQVVDQREKVLDVVGQEIMSEDKVTLRLNVVVSYRVVNARASVEAVADVEATLYREAQLAIRAEVGTRALDALLSEKDAVTRAFEKGLRQRTEAYGVRIVSLGIRDVVLPGEMKDLLNQVIEARKAAEANGIARREETSAMRSQVNTAKLMAENPTLMRLRELEVLERVASNTDLTVVLGEEKLGDRVARLL